MRSYAPRVARVTVAFLASVSVSGFAAADADAQCAFDHSSKAKNVKLSMVRATNPCLAPNATTSEGLQACSPPSLPSSYSFAETGSKCEMKLSQEAATQCGTEPSCTELKLSIKCSGIEDSTSTLIDGQSGWSLHIVERSTIDDTDNGDMTLLDVPIDIALPPAQNGKLALNLAYKLNAIMEPALPWTCVSSALVQDQNPSLDRNVVVASIVDPDGKAFATLGTAGTAAGSASCGIDLPQKTKSIKGSLVRAFEGCPISSFPVPNSQTGAGVPSCSPPYALSPRPYDDKSGGCSLSLTQKLGQCTEACAPLTVKLKCSGVELANGTRIDESGWKLRLTARVSTTDPSAGDVTVVDLPVEVALPAFAGGKLSVTSALPELAATPSPLQLRGCTSLELIDARLHDAAGNEFARLGTASFPH